MALFMLRIVQYPTVGTGYPVWLAPSSDWHPIRLEPSPDWHSIGLAPSHDWYPVTTGCPVRLGTSRIGTSPTGTQSDSYPVNWNWCIPNRVWANAQNWRLNHWKKDDSLLSPKEIGILWMNSSVCNTAAERESGEEIDKKSQRRVKNRTLKKRWIKISWHPHHAIYPRELRDWSLLSWHQHYPICLLRWWVSECESTRMKREGHKELCLAQNAKESEWKNSREAEGRPKGAVESSGTFELCNWSWEIEMSRKNRKECDQIFRTEALERVSFLRKSDLSLEF